MDVNKTCGDHLTVYQIIMLYIYNQQYYMSVIAQWNWGNFLKLRTALFKMIFMVQYVLKSRGFA